MRRPEERPLLELQAMRMKMLQSISGHRFAHHTLEIVEADDAEAAAWEKAGIAFPVPDYEVAAGQVHDLTKQLTAATAKSDAIAILKTDIEGKLAAAVAEKKGAQAEMAVHRKSAIDAAARIAMLERELAAATVASPPHPE